jgi:hypothetical protein
VERFSLVRGGPLYAGMCRMRLVRGDRHDVVRQSLLFVVITWVPIAVMAIGTGRAHPEQNAFLRDLSVHVRLLIAVPLFFVAGNALDQLCWRAIATFRGSGLVRPKNPDPVAPILRRAGRWRDAAAAEGVMLGAVYTVAVGVWKTTGQAGLLSEAAAAMAWSPARAWYGLVALPVFNFLLLRALYRWAIWSGILLMFSRLELDTMPTHPDNAGGLESLAEPSLGFSFLLTGLSAVIASVWGSHVLYDGVSAKTYVDEFAVLVGLCEILTLAPLLAFSAGLLRTRLEGLVAYGRFALRYTRAFQRRWIESSHTEGLLGSSDIQSLADLANSFEVVRRMRIVPFGTRHALVVLIAIALPMAPLVLTEIGFHQLLEGIGHAVLGGLTTIVWLSPSILVR